ncbi:MAG: hypothetical protein ABIR96_12110 [Bdellovibrionota bacterium]
MGTAIQDKKYQAAGMIEDIKNDVKSKAKEFSSDQKLDDVVLKAKTYLDEGVQKASDLYDTSVAGLEKTIKARPVIALAVAFAAGIATVAFTRSLMSKSDAK